MEFSGDGSQIVTIDTVDDIEREDLESFTINITTTDDFVDIIGSAIQVFIQDNGNGIDL